MKKSALIQLFAISNRLSASCHHPGNPFRLSSHRADSAMPVEVAAGSGLVLIGRRLASLSFALLFLSAARGATLDVVYSFAQVAGGPHYAKAGLVQVGDGTFYGTTSGGGSGNIYGTVFKVTPAGVMTKLFSFNNSNGAYPEAGLVRGNDGKFYGTTSQGGSNGKGTVFAISTNGSLSGTVSFTGTGAAVYGFNGSFPRSRLVEGNAGVFYGTAYQGGTSDMGTVFRYNYQSSTLTPLASFTGDNGRYPQAGLVFGNDGNLYGTTLGGGQYNAGVIFKMTPSGTLTRLVSLSTNTGSYPYAGLVKTADGNFFGTASAGGAYGWGTVFKVTPSGTITVLASFNGTNGSLPSAGLIRGTDGNLYGTTYQGGVAYVPGVAIGSGTVFKITTNGSLTSLASFGFNDGAYPSAELIEAIDGELYGTANDLIFRVNFVPPTISITRSSGNVILTWPSATGFTLQQNGEINSTNWTSFNGTVNQNGTIMSATISAPVGKMFFRLVHP